MSTDKQTHLLDDLQSLLEKQMELVQQGNISGVEVLSKQAHSLVGEIAQTGILELRGFKKRRERLQKLYESLLLAITAQRAEAARELSQVRKGKKTVEAYRSNI
ncbi:MAG: hypothetical protein ACYS6W_00160 [Planctomycetota bacterium]|jgi:hypothetical protein